MDTLTGLDALAERVASGGALTDEDAELVLGSHDLIAIGMLADEVRRRMHGTRTTFVRVFEMHVDAPLASLPAGVNAGEFRIVGRPTSVEAAVAAAAAAKRLAGATPLTGFSLADVIALHVDLADVCNGLRHAGLDGIAHVPVDLIPDAAAAVNAARHTGLRVERMTVNGASDDSRLAVVARARALQRAAGGFRAFAPLARTVSATTPTTGYDDVKLVAVARLLATEIPSIQVDWTGYGPKLAQVALMVGADDVDGVAASDPGTLGTRRSAIEEIKGNIRAAGLEPVERNGWFEVLA
jgi:aminodeoxyfutalosine synthase